jgi:putative peptidoglycan lipid II flippase
MTNDTKSTSENTPRPKNRFHFRSVVSLANRKLPIRFAAIVLASSTLVSALLGIFRDRLLNSYYLDTYPTGIDAYTAAFTIPDFLFFLLTSGALAVSFIPVFNQRLSSGNKKSAWELSSSLLNLMAIMTLVASVLIMIFAEPLVRYIVGPGLDESGTILAINMMRVIAINPFLFSISTILSSIQQALGRFVFYALAPALYNVGILVGIVWFTGGINLFGWQIFEGGIMGVALGVVFGAILQVIVSLIGLFGLGFDYEFKINWKNQGFRSVLKLLPARSLDQGIDYANTLVTTNLSSRMGAGALRSYNQAYSLSQMPVSLIGVAISTAFFPQLTEELGEGKEAKYRQTFRTALGTIIWIALPVAVVAFFTRGYVVSFIKNGGDPLISSILATLIISIVANSIFHIAARGFYAYQDTKTPFYVSIVAVGFTILLAVLFSVLGCGVEGLGWAQSIGTSLEVIILIALLQKRSNHKLLDHKFWKNTLRIVFAAAVTGCVAYSLTKFFPFMASDDSIFMVFPKFCVITIGSLIVYIIAGYFLDLEQVQPIIQRLKKILLKTK